MKLKLATRTHREICSQRVSECVWQIDITFLPLSLSLPLYLSPSLPKLCTWPCHDYSITQLLTFSICYKPNKARCAAYTSNHHLWQIDPAIINNFALWTLGCSSALEFNLLLIEYILLPLHRLPLLTSTLCSLLISLLFTELFQKCERDNIQILQTPFQRLKGMWHPNRVARMVNHRVTQKL